MTTPLTVPTSSNQLLDSPAVMAEVLAGDGKPISHASRVLSTPPVTVWRWLTDGVTSRVTGERVRLEACRVGCRWKTSDAAIARFVAALNGTADAPAPTPALTRSAATRSPQREAEVAAAQAKLHSIGI